jgi:hypothetical protein
LDEINDGIADMEDEMYQLEEKRREDESEIYKLGKIIRHLQMERSILERGEDLPDDCYDDSSSYLTPVSHAEQQTDETATALEECINENVILKERLALHTYGISMIEGSDAKCKYNRFTMGIIQALFVATCCPISVAEFGKRVFVCAYAS